MKKKEARKKCTRFDTFVGAMRWTCVFGIVLSIFFSFFDSKLCILLSIGYKWLAAISFSVLIACTQIIRPSYRDISRKHVFEGDPEEEVDEDDMDFL